MKVAVFSTKPYDKEFLNAQNQEYRAELHYFEPHLNPDTCKLAHGYEAVCVFVNDVLNETVIRELHAHGTRLIALRCSGFNNVDLKTAAETGIQVVRVPAYSPQGVAEHAVALILALNRQIHRAHHRVRENNFSLDGLLGFEVSRLKVGVVGTGAIGRIMIRIMRGFGAEILAFDPFPHEEARTLGASYVGLEELFRESDIISLHSPLVRETYHMINARTIGLMKKGVMLINTSRGGLIDARAVIDGLKSGKIGYLGLDVYEEEGDLFFEDLSSAVLKDDVFARLTTFPNVIITAHQAFFTRNAMNVISETTLRNITDFKNGKVDPKNEVVYKQNTAS